ncbi:hypothetical protein LZ30DRAFT_348940 [Colletotrichum cereale]|nr:hypothetical protein LZ30DRAFT_348940 [Colletotrichum cereale]
MQLWCQRYFQRVSTITTSNVVSCYNLFLPFMGQERSQTLSFHLPCQERKENVSEHEHPQPKPRPTLSRKEKRRASSRFRKRRQTFVKAAHKLHRDYDVDVYVAIRKGGRFFSYSSTTDESWRPATSKAVS